MVKWIPSKIGVKLLITFSLVLVLSMGSLIFISTRLINKFGEIVASRNEATIRDNVKSFLARITHEQAMKHESTFKKFATSSSLIAKQCAFFLDNTALYGKTPLKPNEKMVIYPHNGIFSNDASEAAMVLYWGSSTMSPGINEQINTLSHLDPLLEHVKKTNPESVACYSVTETAIARYYPNLHSVEKLPPPAKFDVRNANWYVIAKPENNPERKTVWSNIYLDSVGQGLLMTASTPVYSKTGRYLGAAGVDVTLDKIISDILGHIPSCHQMEGMFSFLVDDQGRIIAFPNEYLEMCGLKIDQDKLVDATVVLKYSLLDSTNPEIRKMGQSTIDTDYQISSLFLNDQSYTFSSHFMPSTRWRLGVVVPESYLLSSVQETHSALASIVKKTTFRFTVVTVLFLIGSIIVLVIFSIKNIIRPIDKLATGTLRVEEGDLTSHIDIYSKDEFGKLAHSFNNMIDALRKGEDQEKRYTENLEQKVKEKTNEITIKNEELQKTLQERKQMQDALKEANDIINRSPAVAFLWKNAEGWPVEFVSKNVEELFGYTADELTSGKVSYAEAVHPDDLERVAEEISTFSKEKERKEFVHKPYRIITKNGEVKWLDDRTHIRRNEKGEITHFEGIVIDITDHIKAEEDKKEIEAKLQQAQKMEAIGTLAGGIAHDFNNLLTTIIANAHMMLMGLGKSDPLREEIEDIKNAGEVGAALTRRLLAFSSRQVIKPLVLDLNQVLADFKKMLNRLLKEDIELKVVLEPGLWKVTMDPSQIEQVVMNLIVNAGEAMPHGGELTVETANVELAEDYFSDHELRRQTGPYVMLAVSDKGIGMDEQIRSHIFEPFFTTKGLTGGTGLGLSTVYGIVKQNGGYVWVYSEPGQGSAFKIYLPRVIGDVDSRERERIPMDALRGTETVLIVEDNDSIRKTAEKALQMYGYRSLAAANGKEALRIIEGFEDPIHLMITDVVMPGMSGLELAERLQSLRPEVKVIYMSGYTDKAIDHRVLEQGVHFMAKPFSPEDLVRKMREVLEQ